MELNSEDFNSKYTLDQSIYSDNFPDTPGLLEIYGEDFEVVKSLSNTNRLWTAIDNDNGKLTYTAGLHYCNRIYYLVTVEPYQDPKEYYTIEE